jgi:hypothetical protein
VLAQRVLFPARLVHSHSSQGHDMFATALLALFAAAGLAGILTAWKTGLVE